MQRIPRPGDAIEYEGHRFTVDKMEGHRIERVKIETTEQAKTAV
jgi:CBS domain containing-hemolysin-like protein